MLQGLPTVLQWLTHSLQTLHCLWIMAKVCVSISVFHTVDFSKTNVIGINNFTICIYWLLLRHKFELVCCRSRVTVIHSPAVQDVYFFGKMSGRGCSHNMCFSHLGHIYQTHPTTWWSSTDSLTWNHSVLFWCYVWSFFTWLWDKLKLLCVSVAKLYNFIRCCKRLVYCDNSVPPISEIFSDADDSLSDSIITNSNHVLYSYLPERRCLIYNLRERSHNRSLITKTTYLNEHDFFIRILYNNCYWFIPSCV